MKNTKRNFWLNNLWLIILITLNIVVLTPLLAQADSLWEKQVGMGTETDQVGHVFDESATDRNNVSDIRIVLAKIIRVFLGFMGIIFLILIIYGGIMWMTAGGKDDNINKAKSLLVAGVIGLIIVVSSFAIAQLVTDKVFEASQTTTPLP